MATAAIASTGVWINLLKLSASGVQFSDGAHYFYKAGGNHGALRYTGNLYDTAADGDNPFVHAKVQGYGYGAKIYNNGGKNSKRWVDQSVWDPAATSVSYGWVQACTDRGSAIPDDCKTSSKLQR